jgi:hypothetical protein
VPPKDFKLRWRVKDSDGSDRVLQRPVKNRTSLSAAEVLTVVETHSKKHFGDGFGLVMKIEVIEKNAETKTKVYRAVNESDRFRLPLVFPGPVFKDLHVLELRVTYSEPPTLLSIPKALQPIASLPALVDCGVNLFEARLRDELDNHLVSAFAAGVSQLVTLSVDADTSAFNAALAQRYVGSVFALVGVHPSHASTFPPTNENIERIRALAKQPGVVVRRVMCDVRLFECVCACVRACVCVCVL